MTLAGMYTVRIKIHGGFEDELRGGTAGCIVIFCTNVRTGGIPLILPPLEKDAPYRAQGGCPVRSINYGKIKKADALPGNAVRAAYHMAVRQPFVMLSYIQNSIGSRAPSASNSNS